MSRSLRQQALAWMLGIAVGFAVGCEPEDFSLDPGGGSTGGPVCYEDAECVPNDCCGQGTAIVHESLAPSCSAVECSGEYPEDTINQGQCIAYCRDSRCTAACN